MKPRHFFTIIILIILIIISIVWNITSYSTYTEGIRSQRRERQSKTATLGRNLEKRQAKQIRYANEDTQGRISEIKEIVEEKPTNAIVKNKDKLAGVLAKLREEGQQPQA